jgi:anti-sigma28 factor (negative regulator of flagellin synthesis)
VIVEGVTAVKALPGSQSEVQGVQIKQQPDAQVKMELAIALGVQAVKTQGSVRAARMKEVHARFEAGTYRMDGMAIAQKLLEIE